MKRFPAAAAMMGALLAVPPAGASSVGAINGTLFSGGSAADTGARERIELEPAGTLLTGRARISSVERIALLAPGVDRGHLLLREIELADGRRSLLLSAAPRIASKIERATLFMRLPSAHWVVDESAGGQVLRHVPQRIAADAELADSEANGELFAVAVRGLGPFWLLDKPTPNAAAHPVPAEEHSARTLLGADAGHAWLPIAAALLLLMLAHAGSAWVHRTEGRND